MEQSRPALLLLLLGLCCCSLHPRALVLGGTWLSAQRGERWTGWMVQDGQARSTAVRLRGGGEVANSAGSGGGGEERIKTGSRVLVLHIPSETIASQQHAGELGVVVGEEQCQEGEKCVEKGKGCSWNVKFEDEGCACIHRVSPHGKTKLMVYDESSPEHLSLRGMSLMRLHGDQGTMRGLFERALEINPEHVNSLARSETIIITNIIATTNMPNTLVLILALIISFIATIITIPVIPVITTWLSSYAHFLHSKERELDQAHEIFTRALEIQPDHTDSLCYLGGLCLDDACKQYDQAERYFKECLRIDPHHVNALAFYGLLMQEVGFAATTWSTTPSSFLLLPPPSSSFLFFSLSSSFFLPAFLPPPSSFFPLPLPSSFLLLPSPSSSFLFSFLLPSFFLLPHSSFRNLLLPSSSFFFLISSSHLSLQVKKDYRAAERMMSQALIIEPRHPEALSHFATFMGKVHQDYVNAEKMYDLVRGCEQLGERGEVEGCRTRTERS
eukprot:763439-Hanusia_phi.AAC.1